MFRTLSSTKTAVLFEALGLRELLEELLGHTDLSTTQVYLSIIDHGLHDAVATLEKENEAADGPWGIDDKGNKVPMTY